MIRAKGYFWLATRPEWVGELSQAGAQLRNEAMGFWWASVPKTRWPDDLEWREHIDKMWDQVYGDRRQEIVFIGAELDEAALRHRLDDCLVSETTGHASQGLEPATGPIPRLETRRIQRMMERPRLSATSRPQSSDALGNGDAHGAGILIGHSPELF